MPNKHRILLHPNDSIQSSSHECILSEAVARVLGASQSAPEANCGNINSLNIKWNDSIERFDLKILKYLQKASSQHNLQIHLLAIHSVPKETPNRCR